jgi:hypothetical protein
MKSPRRLSAPRTRSQVKVRRLKRALVVLTYRNDQLDAIHSSTPSVQFVRLNVCAESLSGSRPIDFSLVDSSQQMVVPALRELSADLRGAAQRAFRRI